MDMNFASQLHASLDHLDKAFLCLCHKVDMPNSITSLDQTPMFESYVNKCDSNNGYQNGVCLREIGPHAQNMLSIIGSIFNIIGKTTY